MGSWVRFKFTFNKLLPSNSEFIIDLATLSSDSSPTLKGYKFISFTGITGITTNEPLIAIFN